MKNDFGFRIIFFTLFVSMLVIRGYYRRKARQTGENTWTIKKDAVNREGKRGILIRLFLFFAAFAVVILYAVNHILFNSLTFPFPTWLRWLGSGLSLVSLFLFIWVHHTCGELWSANLQLRKEHKFITDGPYNRIRHPMYTSLSGIVIGLALVSAFWLVMILAVVSVVFFYLRTGKEEKMMIERFDNEYNNYINRTGRFLPRFTSKHD